MCGAITDHATLEPAAAVVLAAGAATRMGSPKQLLPFRAGTLLSHVVRQALAAGFAPVIVVLGSHASEVARSLTPLPVETVENSDWALGMGSSIRTGIEHLQQLRRVCPQPLGVCPHSVAILLADQPLVEAGHLLEMRSLLAERTDAAVVAAQYDGRLGVPALFRSSMLPLLAGLSPETGARDLLRQPGVAAVAFNLPEAKLDIDTPADFEALAAAEAAHPVRP